MKVGYNLGSGQRPFFSVPGYMWVNVDKHARDGMPRPDVIADAAHLPATDDCIADYVVLSHTAEHFGCNDATGLIAESYRILKPGGRLLVTVPDMRALASGWLASRISTQIYLTCVYGAFMGNDEDRHKWGFDYASLMEFLSSAATWSSVGPLGSWVIPGMDLARDWWILGMECVK